MAQRREDDQAVCVPWTDRNEIRIWGSLGPGWIDAAGISQPPQAPRQQQMTLLDKGRMPKELYLAYLTCPRCAEQRGGEKILVLRRWKENARLASRGK